MNEASQKIESIKSIFLDTQFFYAKHDDMSTLIGYLEKIEPEFRSIGYESASMAIALKDFQKNQELNDWLLYAKGPAVAHTTQVHVGLGWAIAKLNLPFLTVVEKIERRLYHRVVDGCGYYDGSFRQRQTVINQQLPAYLPEAAIPIYYQGVGRSLWYSSNADITRVRSKIESFPPERHADLWRGTGIAVAYAGGCDEDTLKTLLQYAGTNSGQLATGAALAAKSRREANAVTADTDRCSRLWFRLTGGEANMVLPDTSNLAAIENEKVYFNWIKKTEEDLAKSFETGYL
jgi:enediyne biosynthesis protein E3